MTVNCFRCGRSAFATLKIEAAIGATRLKIGGDAGETCLCAPCVIRLADWFKGGHDAESTLAAGSRSSPAHIFARCAEGTEAVSQAPFVDSTNV